MKNLVVFLTITAGCQFLQPKPCTVYLRNDGGQTPRPYYAVEVCDGKPPRVLCDSPTPLPTANCPTQTVK